MSTPCAVWDTQTLQSGPVADRDADYYDSPRAGGEYIITRSAKSELHYLSTRQKAYLTTWLIAQRRAGNDQPTITVAEIKIAEAATAKSLTARRDSMLNAIQNHSSGLGQSVTYSNANILPYILAETESLQIFEVSAIVRFCTNDGLISSYGNDISLTYSGYSRLEELSFKASSLTQVFVAMWFGSEVAQAYNEGIVPAIIDAGYKPMRIDQKEHNNKIDDEIIAEIRRSRFLVADFTCGLVEADRTMTAIPRGGVYYEAGFAQGLGIPVIWCCREDHINHVHFDTRQFNHITWTTPEELREKLRNRIGAVIGDGPGAI
ncbi:hypothetical protein [Agrobacterium rosae]|uniref:hypothetical protein n=1 Tax=Agrobacterium rosae TaxID=1972867 RepID=UPI000CD97BCB|nr:hypothetical protein [Agrobacterium rosae]POO56164.1 hypothetical protein CTT39_05305 [Agrobacterium rosae]